MIPSRCLAVIEAIQNDNVSGAAALMGRAVDVLSMLDSLPPDRAPAASAEVARALVRAQPAMAPMWNLADRVLHAMDRGENVAIASHRFLSEANVHSAAVCRRVADLIPEDGTIVTHSRSGTVENALILAAGEQRRFRVICTESRPMCEGTALARRLGESRIGVTLVVDAAMLTALDRADVVLVGADAVSIEGFTNKIGTSLLAEAAEARGVRFYAVCTSEKFLPTGFGELAERSRPAEEIAKIDLPTVTVENRYFERTPLERLTGLVMEDGVQKPAELRERLDMMALHPALLFG